MMQPRYTQSGVRVVLGGRSTGNSVAKSTYRAKAPSLTSAQLAYVLMQSFVETQSTTHTYQRIVHACSHDPCPEAALDLALREY